jgi:exosortase
MAEMRSHVCFAGLLLLGAVVYFFPIGALAKLVFENETYSHIGLIPLVSLFLLVTQRKSIFAGAGRKPAAGFAVCAGGLVFYGLATVLREHLERPAFRNQDVPNDYLTLGMAGAVAWVIGSFIAVYGTHAFKKARFALLFLVFTIPLPMFLLEGIVSALQHASAEASDIIFRLIGAPYHRSGLVFEFPNVAVRVAEECSGIRSSLSLFILSLITGYLFLRTFSRRVVLALAIFPITVVKNAFRIVTITLLANYVDLRFITNHWIHRSGGIPFFAVAMAMFIPLVWALRRTEVPGARPAAQDAGQAAAEANDRFNPAQRKE